VLACGVPSAAGALLALAHPATVATAFLAAPVTTLHPLIGAGHVTALVQTLLRPPRVRELREVSADALAFTRWWRNRLLRILLVFVLTTLGSALGAWLGGAKLLARVL
jgi:pheromone shutdown protein TraB